MMQLKTLGFKFLSALEQTIFFVVVGLILNLFALVSNCSRFEQSLLPNSDAFTVMIFLITAEAVIGSGVYRDLWLDN